MCVFCRDTDEIHRHPAPVERVPSGRGVGGDVGAYGAPLPLETQIANLASELRALRAIVARLVAEARASREP